MKRRSTNVLGRARGAVGTGERVFLRGQHFAQRWFDAWAGYGTRVFSATKAASQAQPGSFPFFLVSEYAAAAAEAYGAVFDAGTALVSGTFGLQQGSIVLAFDSDAEMAGPAFLNLPHPPTAVPVASDLVLAGTRCVIPSAHVRPRVDGATLSVTLVNLDPKFAGFPVPLVPGTYTGEIDIGGSTSVSVTASYGGDCTATPPESVGFGIDLPCITISVGSCGSCGGSHPCGCSRP